GGDAPTEPVVGRGGGDAPAAPGRGGGKLIGQMPVSISSASPLVFVVGTAELSGLRGRDVRSHRWIARIGTGPAMSTLQLRSTTPVESSGNETTCTGVSFE